jgi:hypothetical protein
LAVANYHETYKCYPPPFIADANGKPMHSWRVLLLPYLERNDIYKQYRFDEPWDGPNNRKLADQIPTQYVLHGCAKAGNVTTNYLRVVGDETASPADRVLTQQDIKDGRSNTLFIVENVDSGIHWMEPRDLDFDSMSFTISERGGISSWLEPPAALCLDGTVKSIPPQTPADVVRALLTRAGSEDAATKFFGQELADGRNRPRGKSSPCGYSRLESPSP